eukprot:313084-Chlamydomonas_euryale.AAC.2
MAPAAEGQNESSMPPHAVAICPTQCRMRSTRWRCASNGGDVLHAAFICPYGGDASRMWRVAVGRSP